MYLLKKLLQVCPYLNSMHDWTIEELIKECIWSLDIILLEIKNDFISQKI